METINENLNYDIDHNALVAAKLIKLDKSQNYSNDEYSLFHGENVIGRGKHADVIIDHESLSEIHAEICISNEGVACIKDYRSENGTFVNNLRLKRKQKVDLVDGASIRLGGLEFRFILHETSQTEENSTDQHANTYVDEAADATEQLIDDEIDNNNHTRILPELDNEDLVVGHNKQQCIKTNDADPQDEIATLIDDSSTPCVESMHLLLGTRGRFESDASSSSAPLPPSGDRNVNSHQETLTNDDNDDEVDDDEDSDLSPDVMDVMASSTTATNDTSPLPIRSMPSDRGQVALGFNTNDMAGNVQPRRSDSAGVHCLNSMEPTATEEDSETTDDDDINIKMSSDTIKDVPVPSEIDQYDDDDDETAPQFNGPLSTVVGIGGSMEGHGRLVPLHPRSQLSETPELGCADTIVLDLRYGNDSSTAATTMNILEGNETIQRLLGAVTAMEASHEEQQEMIGEVSAELVGAEAELLDLGAQREVATLNMKSLEDEKEIEEEKGMRTRTRGRRCGEELNAEGVQNDEANLLIASAKSDGCEVIEVVLLEMIKRPKTQNATSSSSAVSAGEATSTVTSGPSESSRGRVRGRARGGRGNGRGRGGANDVDDGVSELPTGASEKLCSGLASITPIFTVKTDEEEENISNIQALVDHTHGDNVSNVMLNMLGKSSTVGGNDGIPATSSTKSVSVEPVVDCSSPAASSLRRQRTTRNTASVMPVRSSPALQVTPKQDPIPVAAGEGEFDTVDANKMNQSSGKKPVVFVLPHPMGEALPEPSITEPFIVTAAATSSTRSRKRLEEKTVTLAKSVVGKGRKAKAVSSSSSSGEVGFEDTTISFDPVVSKDPIAVTEVGHTTSVTDSDNSTTKGASSRKRKVHVADVSSVVVVEKERVSGETGQKDTSSANKTESSASNRNRKDKESSPRFDANECTVEASKPEVDTDTPNRPHRGTKRSFKEVAMDEKTKVDKTDIAKAKTRTTSSSSSAVSLTSSTDVSDDHPRLIFTGIPCDDELKRKVEKIGGIFVETPDMATHLVTSTKLKRTPKLLAAINAGVRYIVTERWLELSFKAGKAVSIKSFDSDHIIHDKEKELLWGFNMRDTLAIPRGYGTPGVFHNIAVFVTDGVYGNQFPPKDEFQLIIRYGGGLLVDSLTGLDTKSASASSLIVVSNEEVVKTKCGADVWNAVRKGPGKGIYSSDFIYLAVLRQRLDFDCGLLVPSSSSSTTSAVAAAVAERSSSKRGKSSSSKK